MAELIDTFTWGDAPDGTTHRDHAYQCFIKYDGVDYWYYNDEGLWLVCNPTEDAISKFMLLQGEN